ncbi:(2Fe-2S)-binding protein [Alkalicella caledoniensis]|uniref:(2Fe-2S)-binding protein n=1 Tax=Alkalicella caledoniensis TaxID=2731377 RepID=A0A7G9W5Q4_ALKCA|nr:(2Fe-2S)-binding protein [Alkalicella caledoniensis]QNO14016.1 (2Fe-2S)-binding protein [Alkalicella caledoniensis]
MNQVISADIMDKLQKISLCKGISKASIKKAIKEGAKTLKEVEKATGASSGPCKGKRCAHKIGEILEETR